MYTSFLGGEEGNQRHPSPVSRKIILANVVWHLIFQTVCMSNGQRRSGLDGNFFFRLQKARAMFDTGFPC